jgi:hypothetical protein
LSFGALIEKKSGYWSMLDGGYRKFFGALSMQTIVAALSMRTGWYAHLVLQRLIDSFRYYLDNVARIPQDQAVVLRYEDLCRDPQSCLDRIGAHLGLPMKSRIPERFVARRNRPILARARRQYARERDALIPYLGHLNYALYP